jgi:hypothetical protein
VRFSAPALAAGLLAGCNVAAISGTEKAIQVR